MNVRRHANQLRRHGLLRYCGAPVPLYNTENYYIFIERNPTKLQCTKITVDGTGTIPGPHLCHKQYAVGTYAATHMLRCTAKSQEGRIEEN